MPRPETLPQGATGPAPRWLGPVVALAVSGAFFLGTARVGHLLVRDFVTVPHPVLGAAAHGGDGIAPRALVLDVVMAVLDPVVPSALQQRLLLVGSVFILGSGVAALVRSRGKAAVVVATVVATWNPYVIERLLLGQAPTLLGVAATPWLVLAARTPSLRSQITAVFVAALPAMITPFGSVLAVGVVGVVGAQRLGPRRGVLLTALGSLWCLPWLVAALKSGATGGAAAGAAAFAVRDDSAWGLAASVVSWGGIWAPGAHLASRDSHVTMLASAFVVAAIVLAAVIEGRRGSPAVSLTALWAIPILLALALTTDPGLMVFEWMQGIPGVALLRDTHRLLGVSVIAGAILLGSLASRATRGAPTAVVASVLVCAVSVVILTVPDGPGRLWRAYTPSQFPTEWSVAVAAIPDDARGVLVLPWQPIRPAAWGGHVPFLDPVPRALLPPTVTAHDLTIRRDVGTITVPEGDVTRPVLTSPAESRVVLEEVGVDAVWWWGRPDAPLPTGYEIGHSGPEFTVWRRSE